MAVSAEAQEKKIKIGVIFDLTGPLGPAGGSELQYTGVKINARPLRQEPASRVYKIETVYADAQSKARHQPSTRRCACWSRKKVDNADGLFLVGAVACRCRPASTR